LVVLLLVAVEVLPHRVELLVLAVQAAVATVALSKGMEVQELH
jgi:hypothetical protein